MSATAQRPPMHMGEQSMEARTATQCARLLDYHVPRLLRQQVGTRTSRAEIRAAIRETRKQIAAAQHVETPDGRRPVLESERAEIVRLYRDERLSTAVIALRLNRCQRTIALMLRRAGVTVARPTGLRAQIVERFNRGLGRKEIAADLGCHLGSVYRVLEKIAREKKGAA